MFSFQPEKYMKDPETMALKHPYTFEKITTAFKVATELAIRATLKAAKALAVFSKLLAGKAEQRSAKAEQVVDLLGEYQEDMPRGSCHAEDVTASQKKYIHHPVVEQDGKICYPVKTSSGFTISFQGCRIMANFGRFFLVEKITINGHVFTGNYSCSFCNIEVVLSRLGEM